MENEKKNFIVDHALLTEDNFLIATQVAKSYEEIMNKLVGDLLRKLVSILEEALGPEWESETGFEDHAFDKWYFIIFKKSWFIDERSAYYFGFESDRRKLSDFYFFSMRNDEIIKNPINDIYKALNENYRKGRKATYFDWWQYVDQDYLNWTDDKTVVKLYRQDEMVRYFSEQIIKMKEIIEPIIDVEIKNYK